MRQNGKAGGCSPVALLSILPRYRAAWALMFVVLAYEIGVFWCRKTKPPPPPQQLFGTVGRYISCQRSAICGSNSVRSRCFRIGPRVNWNRIIPWLLTG